MEMVSISNSFLNSIQKVHFLPMNYLTNRTDYSTG